MIYDFYVYVHDVLNVHFWDVLTIIAAVLVIAVWAGHRHNQKKREKEFNEDMDQRIQAMEENDKEFKPVNS